MRCGEDNSTTPLHRIAFPSRIPADLSTPLPRLGRYPSLAGCRKISPANSFYGRHFPAEAIRRRPDPDVCRRRRPERTNKRFHYVSPASPRHTLSTAFDSVTLIWRRPRLPPRIFMERSVMPASASRRSTMQRSCTAASISATPGLRSA